jgi:hypothetical protein
MSVEATRGGGRSPTRIDCIEIGLGTKTPVGRPAPTHVTIDNATSDLCRLACARPASVGENLARNRDPNCSILGFVFGAAILAVNCSSVDMESNLSAL